MELFNKQSLQKQREIVDDARRFLLGHEDHVSDLIAANHIVREPSTDEMFKPAKWKSVHWNWFFRNWPQYEPKKKPWPDPRFPWKLR